ncbi:putative Mg2+ transporter-C (MgtC) family protein [Phyllobacterium sp. YR620]|nr:putative Mg2+ transporter-C (MgtC) family protein [Phyllobacterium sp. YR620]
MARNKPESATVDLYLTWEDIAIRLGLTVVAGAIIGFNREASGHAAGLRTTLLVGLAACMAMIQANLLLTTVGKPPDSFVNIDVMRLPLGILTGVGFIGGGAIFKRGDLVSGVTTAATLWIMTAIGLAFGSGLIELACVATALVYLILWAMKLIDIRISRERKAFLTIVREDSETSRAFEQELASIGYRTRFMKQYRRPDSNHVTVTYEVRWHRPEIAGPPLDLIEFVEKKYTIELFDTILDSDRG